MYQIVYSTKHSEPTLESNNRKELYTYICGILKNKKCHLCQIGGLEDHLHIITHIHPTVALSDLIKDIKLASTEHIKHNSLFKNFNGWQDARLNDAVGQGYGAFTYSIDAKDNLIHYVKNQEEHHEKKTFIEELKELLHEHKIDFDGKYLL